MTTDLINSAPLRDDAAADDHQRDGALLSYNQANVELRIPRDQVAWIYRVAEYTNFHRK
jgi:hypothetical protein